MKAMFSQNSLLVMLLSTPGCALLPAVRYCLTVPPSILHYRPLTTTPLVPLAFIPCLSSVSSGRVAVVLCTFPLFFCGSPGRSAHTDPLLDCLRRRSSLESELEADANKAIVVLPQLLEWWDCRCVSACSSCKCLLKSRVRGTGAPGTVPA